MQRPNRGIQGFTAGGCKIRKRGCSSLSSSSSLLPNYRFKRAILVGKKGGTSTPVPNWRMNLGSPTSPAGTSVSSKPPLPSQTVSARKLATALWEMNEIPSPRMKEGRRSKEIRGRDRRLRSIQTGSIHSHLSDPSHSPSSETTSRSKSANYGRRIPVVPQKFRPIEFQNQKAVDSLSNASFMEIESRSRCFTPSNYGIGTKSSLKHVSNGFATSKELLKVLDRIWGLEEQHSSSRSLVTALRVELERARAQVDQLTEEQRLDRNEINYLKKQFMKEKMGWKSKEQDRVNAAAKSIMEELDLEKKLRRRAERLSKKLSMELTETKTLLSKVTKELQNEKRSREMIERICDEIVRGVGDDKAEVEEMKKESAKVREELEKEREMLQLADVWREERVQMKLAEAKFQFEEKNEAVDRLRNELDAYLKNKRKNNTRIGCRNLGGKLEVEDLVQLVHPGKTNVFEQDIEGEVVDGEADENDGVDSADSDLHSIELNMDTNSKNYSWSYANGTTKEATKTISIGENTNVMCSNYEDSLRGNSSIHRGISEGIEKNSRDKKIQDLVSMFDQGRDSENSGHPRNQANKLDSDAERYRSVKGLRDHFLSGSRLTSTRNMSPTRQWRQTQPLSEDEDDYDGVSVAAKVKALKETASKASLTGGKGETHNSKCSQLQVAPKT